MEYGQMSAAPSRVEDVPTDEPSTMQDMRAVMEQYWSTAADRARDAAAYADRRVQQNPWTAVGIGFGVGMVFGALVAMLASSQRSVMDRIM